MAYAAMDVHCTFPQENAPNLPLIRPMNLGLHVDLGQEMT